MTQILFVFDTEDYTNPRATDAILRYAQILTANGVRGCFNVVGEVAAALEEQGRRDVIDALAAHEIDYHSWRHTWHPTPIDYCDGEDWYEGLHRTFDEERRGAMMVKRVFHRDQLFAAVPPGNSINTQLLQVYSSLGIPIYAGSVFTHTDGRGLRFVNMVNLDYDFCADELHHYPDAEAFLNQYLGDLRGRQRVVIYAHPNRAEHPTFWDKLNCDRENLVEFGDWILPERYSDEEIDRFYREFEKVVRYFANTPGFEVVTFEQVAKETADKRRPLCADRLAKLLEQTEQKLAYAELDGEYYSLAELYEAAIHFVSTPARVADGTFTPRGIIGPLNDPMQIDTPFTCTAAELTAAATANRVADTVPEKLTVAGREIGPTDFMRAARQFLQGADTISLEPHPQELDYSGCYGLEYFKLKDTWLHSKDFHDERSSHRVHLQAWSFCPAE